MRRLGQWMLKALTALSLLLCVGTSVLWVRGYWVGNAYTRRDGPWYVRISHSQGEWAFFRNRETRRPLITTWESEAAWPPGRWDPAPGDPGFRSAKSFPGLAWYITDGGVSQQTGKWITAWHGEGVIPAYPISYSACRIVYVRDWLLASVLALLPAIHILRWRRRVGPFGFCSHCSYDLTANVSGVCPECGTKIAEAK